VPDYSTLCRRQKTLSVAITARPNNAGLHLLIDSTGVKMLGEGEWKTKKHGADYRR
jgi:IS5 family transposase